MLQLTKTSLSKRKTAVLLWKKDTRQFSITNKTAGKRGKHRFMLKYITGCAKAETSTQENFSSKYAGRHLPLPNGGIEPCQFWAGIRLLLLRFCWWYCWTVVLLELVELFW